MARLQRAAGVLIAACLVAVALPATARADGIDYSNANSSGASAALTASTAGISYLETGDVIFPLNVGTAFGSGPTSPATYRTQDDCIEVALNARGCHVSDCFAEPGHRAGVTTHVLVDPDGDGTNGKPNGPLPYTAIHPTPCLPLDTTFVRIADLDTEIATALRDTIPVPASPLTVQPPGGQTLTGLPSLFRAELPAGATEDTRSVAWTFPYQAAGSTIPVTITGSPSYLWDFGDSATLTADVPGTLFTGADPRDHPSTYPVRHTYTKTGDVTVTETTTWAFTYRLPSGTRRTVPGTVTRTSTTTLTVTSIRARLVAPGNG